MALGRDMLIERLRSALQSSVAEVRKDPEFLVRVVNTVCNELGMDPMASLYLASKLRNMVKRDDATG